MSDYMTFAQDLALQAGGIIRQNFSLNMKKEWKEDVTPLTVTDTTINNLVLEAVVAKYPSHAVLAEEKSLNKKQTKYVWVCDPLDGTLAFSHGIPTCVFSLALVYNGIPIIGVVYDPFMDRLFSAKKYAGAYLNNARIHVSDQADVARGLIGIGHAWYQMDLRDVMHELVQRKGKCVDFASNVYMGSLVAAGEFLAVFFQGKFPWDVASLKIIVEEAGGRVTDFFGNEQRYDDEIHHGAIISNGHVHNQLLKLVHTHVR